MRKHKNMNDLHWVKSIGMAFLFSSVLLVPGKMYASDTRSGVATVQQQSKLITGTVLDQNGDPVIGANIAVVGSTTGVSTDLDGKFQLNVNVGAELRVSYIGYLPQTVKVGSQSNYSIVLREDSEVLDEVVVVGYGSMKKSDISGSVVSVNQEEMMKRNPVNIVQGLQGAAAGVMVTKNSGDPTGSATIRIRGVATVNGSADPLYVVDGVQVGSDANFVNPADVESIEILKDASATAIYGARGANGVILITTKKGMKGQTNVNFSANFGIQNMTGKLDVADAELFAYSVRQGRANDNASLINKAFGEDYVGKLRSIDWQDVMTRTALQQNYMLSVSGGTEKSQSSLSIGYLNNEGIVIDSNFSRLTARANTTYQVKDFIEIGGSISFEHNERYGVGYIEDKKGYNNLNMRNYAILTPTMDYVDQITGEFISHNYNDRDAKGSYYTFMQLSGEGDIQKGQDNPYAAKMDEDKTPSYNNTVLASAYMDIKLFKGLSFRTIGSYKLNTYDGSGYGIVNDRILTASQVSNFWLSQSQTNNTALESYFTYNWKTDLHNLNLVAGNTVSNAWRHWVDASAVDFLSDSYRSIELTSDQASRTGKGGYDIKTRYISYYGRAMYSLMDRYIVTGTVRRDGSSNFGKGNRWGTFPSAALAWRLSEEDFIKNTGLFSNLKLRLGWGQTGNAGDPTSLSVAQLSSNRMSYDWGTLGGSTSDYDKVTGVAQDKEIDTNLKWETNTQTNIGLDLGLLGNDLNITMDYFIRDSKDLLLYRNLRPSTGFSRIYTNAGHIKNKGFEMSISYNKRLGDWTIGATLSGSTLKNEVIDVGDPIYSKGSDDGDNWDNHSVTMNGHAVGSYYGYVVEGIFQNQGEVDAANALAEQNGFSAYQVKATVPGDYKYKDLNGDGHIDGDDMTVIGNGFPKLNYGLTLTAGYKNFDAMIYMYGVTGMDINSYASMKMGQLYKTAGGIQNTLKEYINKSWTPQNQSTTHSRMTIVDNNTNMRASTAYIKNGDFLKIANIQIGYTFPRSVLKPVKMESARIFASVENVACFSSYNKYGDPEVGSQNVLFTGFDGGRYPYPRTFTLGLSVQF